MPILRGVNVKNVVVLTDGRQLQGALEYPSGKEFRQHKTYSIHPIYPEGVFHPKIILLTGVKHGLLIIGSGNLTSSGISSNDEIWGAFQLDSVENENAALFGSVWNYLREYFAATKGFNVQKIEWFKTYSPWIEELSKRGDKHVELVRQAATVTFISNTRNQSIWKRMSQLLPHKEKVESITTISPYYDREGVLLADLYERFKPTKMSCIIGDSDCLLPTEMRKSLRSSLSFHRWSECTEEFSADQNRLHSKIFHFQYMNGTEFLFIGSANATWQAWGGAKSSPINAEAGICLMRTGKSNFLRDLGINIPKSTGLDLAALASVPAFPIEPQERPGNKIRILYTELEGKELRLFVTGQVAMGTGVVVLSVDDEMTEVLDIEVPDEELNLNCVHPGDAFRVYIEDSKQRRISGFSPVHRVEFQAKCNPDPDQEKLNLLLDDGNYPDGEGLSELVAYVDYDWADKDELDAVSRDAGASQVKAASITLEKSFEKLSADKFNKVSQDVLQKQAGELNGASFKIAEFLHLVGQGIIQEAHEQYTESEELRLYEDTDQKGEGEEISKKKRPLPSAAKEAKSIRHFLGKISKQVSAELNDFLVSKSLTTAPTRKLTIKNLSNFLIAISLIHLYFGKQFLREDRRSEALEYLEEGKLHSGETGIKQFLVEAFGSFLLLSTAGFKDYGYEMVNKKALSLKEQLLVKAVFAILNLSWNMRETEYRDQLLLNCFYFLTANPRLISDINFDNNLRKELAKLEGTAKRITRSYHSNKHDLFDNLLPELSEWIETFQDTDTRTKVTRTISTLHNNAIMFSSKVGFNAVYKRSVAGAANLLTLKRPGYEWSNDSEEYLLSNVAFGKQCIVFRD